MEVGGLWPGYVSQAHHAITPPGYGHEFLRDLAQLKRGRIYSLVMMSNFRTNFQPVQVADLLFRYSITTHRGDRLQALARDFGWAAATPLVPVTVKGPQQGALSPWASFCRVDRPNVLLVTLKAAEDGDGLILRLRETEGQDTVVIVSLPFLDVCQAFRTNLVEENEASLSYDRHSFRMHLPANGLVTVRCRSSRRWPATGLVASY
jgi:alpha-mannosidase